MRNLSVSVLVAIPIADILDVFTGCRQWTHEDRCDAVYAFAIGRSSVGGHTSSVCCLSRMVHHT